MTPTAVAALRSFVRPRPKAERCELCGVELARRHDHLFGAEHRALRCACPACALLFDSNRAAVLKRVPDRVKKLHLDVDDALWDSLQVPIGLAFFVRSSAADRVVAYYPGPAGATESRLPLEAWGALSAGEEALENLAPDVEALIVNRASRNRPGSACFLTSIADAYALVGVIRASWKGLGGGAEVWGRVQQFFSDLEARSHA